MAFTRGGRTTKCRRERRREHERPGHHDAGQESTKSHGRVPLPVSVDRALVAAVAAARVVSGEHLPGAVTVMFSKTTARRVA
jgi:hypothetical protein